MMVGPPRDAHRARPLLLAAFAGTAVALLAATSASGQAQQFKNQPSHSVDLSAPYYGQPPADDTDVTDVGQQKVGNIAKSSVGTAGQRQGKTLGLTNKPMARLETRITNRVQSRVRNRIDRFYDPQANTISPFVVAADQARTASQPSR